MKAIVMLGLGLLVSGCASTRVSNLEKNVDNLYKMVEINNDTIKIVAKDHFGKISQNEQLINILNKFMEAHYKRWPDLE